MRLLLILAFVVAPALASATPPPPVPPMPPEAPEYLAGPEPVLASTGDPRADAWRTRVFAEGGPAWRPYLLRAFAGVRADPALLAAREEEPATAADYVERHLTPDRIAEGRRLYAELRGREPFLGERKVPAEVLLALWGVLADYGRDPPRFDMVQALMMRGAYGLEGHPARFDIYHAVTILALGRVERARARAYPDGRIGQVRYLPDMYLEWGEDGDGDGRVDIWSDREDILRNLERLLIAWEPGIPLVAEVERPRLDLADAGQRRLHEAMTRGGGGGGGGVRATHFRRADGRPWPEGTNWGGELIEPFGPDGPAFLVTRNFTPVNYASPWRGRYESLDNHNFGLAVGLLADAIAARPPPTRPLP